jgi:hypothetical protein
MQAMLIEVFLSDAFCVQAPETAMLDSTFLRLTFLAHGCILTIYVLQIGSHNSPLLTVAGYRTFYFLNFVLT